MTILIIGVYRDEDQMCFTSNPRVEMRLRIPVADINIKMESWTVKYVHVVSRDVDEGSVAAVARRRSRAIYTHRGLNERMFPVVHRRGMDTIRRNRLSLNGWFVRARKSSVY